MSRPTHEVDARARTSCALKVGNKNREEKNTETSGSSSGRRASKQEEGE